MPEASAEIRIKRLRINVLKWSRRNPRNLPWKESKDPYKIWVSEIILQQTRVDQGMPYYLRFIKRYPTVFHLAKSTDDDLMKVWEGLGYYRRARHMLETSRVIVEKYQGHFPEKYHDILALKGVGNYTASAIASFAFDLPHAVVDGNVIRVITRLQGITEPVETAAIKKQIAAITDSLLDKENPAAFNQAIMDFGALYCTPAKPACPQCILQKDCKAHQQGIAKQIPVKIAKRAKRHRYFYYLVPKVGDQVYVRKRDQKDIWQDLFEFFLIEMVEEVSLKEVLAQAEFPISKSISTPLKFKQTLSHQVVHALFIEVKLEGKSSLLKKQGYQAVKTKNIRNFAFPKVIDCYLRDKGVILNS